MKSDTPESRCTEKSLACLMGTYGGEREREILLGTSLPAVVCVGVKMGGGKGPPNQKQTPYGYGYETHLREIRVFPQAPAKPHRVGWIHGLDG